MNWIKVTDRLPELYQWVLVCNSPKGSGEPRCINIWRWDGNSWDSLDTPENNGDSPTFSDIVYTIYKDEITHWMPLPEQPIDPKKECQE